VARELVSRTKADVDAILAIGDPLDSREAAWKAISKGSEVIRDIQQAARRQKKWTGLKDALPSVNRYAKRILKIRLDALHKFKQPPHHRHGFRLSAATGAAKPRPVGSLCLISGHEGQEIPGFVRHDRVVVDAEHMEQALGPATITEIFKLRKRIGEYVYISTNVSETPQLVRNLKTGAVDTRATAALTASKVLAALNAGVDIVKVGFANLDSYKRDLPSKEVAKQMKIVRETVDSVVKEKAIVMPLNQTGRYPLVSVFFPELGIDALGEKPMDIALKGIELTAKAGWQALLIDTFIKITGRRYADFYSVADTAKLARLAHSKGIELWIAGSITRKEIPALVRAGADLICFGGAARHKEGVRIVKKGKKADETIKRPLVEGLVQAFERSDPRRAGRGR
jgi:uncharacterized protein (UPF0264 family)